MASAYMTDGSSALKTQSSARRSNVVRFSSAHVAQRCRPAVVEALVAPFETPRSYEDYHFNVGDTKEERFKSFMAVVVPFALMLFAVIAPAIF